MFGPSHRVFSALTAALLVSIVPATDAIARDSEATLRARVVELVNDARRKPRKCGSERFAAAAPMIASGPLGMEGGRKVVKVEGQPVRLLGGRGARDEAREVGELLDQLDLPRIRQL